MCNCLKVVVWWVKFLFLSLSLKRTNEPISTFMIQIAVLANHQNGRDTHMRQIKVFTPVEESSIGKFPRCTTVDFMMYRTIRWFVSTCGSFQQSLGPGIFRKLQRVCSNQRKWHRQMCVASEIWFICMWCKYIGYANIWCINESIFTDLSLNKTFKK